MDMPAGHGMQHDVVSHSNNYQHHGLRHWSEGEYSDDMNSNISAGQLYGDNQQTPAELPELDAASSEKGQGVMNQNESREDRERQRTGRQSNHQYHDRKKSRRKSKKKKSKKRTHRTSSSSSSVSSRSRSRSRSRRRHRRHHRSGSYNESSQSRHGYSDNERWMPRRGRHEEESYGTQIPSSTIMVRGLPTHLAENDISLDITQCGISAKDIRLIRYRETGVSRGFAFVEFHDTPDAVKYMELRKGIVVYHEQYEANMIYSVERNGTTMDNGMLTPPKDWFCAKCSAHNFKRREVCYRCQASKVEDGADEPTEEITKYATTTLLLKNLDMLTTEDSILQALDLRRELGSIPTKSVRISRESGTNLSRGVCFVETNSVSDAVRLYDSLTKNPLDVGERVLSVAYCKPPAQTVTLNSAAAAALAAAQWSASSTLAPTNCTPELEIQQLAEYSASLYAKNPEEKEFYLAYYKDYYRNQHLKGEKLATTVGSRRMTGGTPESAEYMAPSTSSKGIAAQPNRSASPDTGRLQFDESTACYYDPLTLLYYDGSSQHFYDSVSMEYLSWDCQKREYVAVSSKPNLEQASTESVPKSKPIKVNISKSVLKDTLKQAIKFNDKKMFKNNVKLENSELVEEKGGAKKEKQETLSEPKASLIRPITGTQGMWVVEAVEKDSGSEDDLRPATDNAENFMELEKLACTLCKRQFQSYDILLKHTQLSSLHKANLATLRSNKTKVESIPSTASTSASVSYRDRAKERRNHFGFIIEPTERNNSLQDIHTVARTTNDQTFMEQSTSLPTKEDNGSKKKFEKWKGPGKK